MSLVDSLHNQEPTKGATRTLANRPAVALSDTYNMASAMITTPYAASKLPSISTFAPNGTARSTTRPSFAAGAAGPRVGSGHRGAVYAVSRPASDGALSPEAAIKRYRHVLTDYEKREILNFPEVYFVGTSAAKKLNNKRDTDVASAGSIAEDTNNGYDDAKARYRCVKNDHLAYRYEVLKGLGKGSFGDVLRCFDHKTKRTVAVKVIRNERRFHKQAVTEVHILELLRNGDKRGTHGVIHMKEHFLFRNHLCIVFEMMHLDLYSELKVRGFKGFPLAEVEKFARQLVGTLRVLRRNRIIHCDLKPENILLSTAGSTDIKVIDFGSSCFLHDKVHTYIQSRYYRSPEVILGLSYGMAIDMWSLGCILVELATGEPLFSGHDEMEQLVLQMEVLGVPDPAVISSSKHRRKYFDAASAPVRTTDNKGRRRTPGSVSLARATGSEDPVFLDFLARCLTWDPELRITPRDANQHELLTRGRQVQQSVKIPSPRSSAASRV